MTQLDSDETSPPTAPRAPTLRRQAIEWIVVVTVAIVAALLVRSFAVQQFRVEGDSMLSTLHDGDRVLVDKLSYRFHDPRRGDIIVLEPVDGDPSDEDLIKRIIGLPGESIEVVGCSVYVDGAQIAEPYLDPAILDADGCGVDHAETVVPSGHVFVLGDHRGASRDSRWFGTVPFGDIVGRARVVIWPPTDMGGA